MESCRSNWTLDIISAVISHALFVSKSSIKFLQYKIKKTLQLTTGPSWPWTHGCCNQCLSPLMLWVRIAIRARCTTLCDKVSQWLATGRWFSPGPPVSPTNKTNHNDISEILLKVALSTIKQTNQTIDDSW
jgi:hypothetical protein